MKLSLALVATLLAAITVRADDPVVEVIRGARWAQTAPGTVVPATGTNAFYFEAEAAGFGSFEPITGPQVTLPGGQSKALTKDIDGNYSVIQNFDSQTARDIAYPAGRYNFSATLNFVGLAKAHALLTDDTPPAAPQILNYSEAQAIDPSAAFTFQLAAFAGAGTDDLVTLELSNPATGELLTQLTDVDSSTSEWSFSPGDLPASKDLALRILFKKVGPPALPDAGELLAGRPEWIAETVVGVKTLTPGGGNSDNTPPSLTNSFPASGGLLASKYQPLVFNFSEAMNTDNASVEWQATLNGEPFPLDPSFFHYIWSDDGKTVICTCSSPSGGWPSGLNVTWILNDHAGAQGNFTDLARNELPRQTGTLVTAGAIDPCDNPIPAGLPVAAFGFSKQVNYIQSSADAAIGDPALGAKAFAFFYAADWSLNTGVVTFKVPTANPFQFKLKVLTPQTGQPNFAYRSFEEDFAARTDLDDAYIGGSYAFELRNTAVVVTNSVLLTIPDTGYPPTPHFSNFGAAQTVSPDASFNLGWDAFPGAVSTNAYVSITIFDSSSNVVFRMPNSCSGAALAPSATGVTIPANTLTNGTSYTVQLDFDRITDSNKYLGGIPGSGFATLRKTTRMALHTTGGGTAASPAKFTGVQLSSAGTLQIQVTCTPGHLLILEGADTPASTYTPILSTNPPSASLTLTVPVTGTSKVFRTQNP